MLFVTIHDPSSILIEMATKKGQGRDDLPVHCQNNLLPLILKTDFLDSFVLVYIFILFLNRVIKF